MVDLKDQKISVFQNGRYKKIIKYPSKSNKFNKMKPILKKKKLLKEIKINNSKIYYINVFHLVNSCVEILKKNNNFFK